MTQPKARKPKPSTDALYDYCKRVRMDGADSVSYWSAKIWGAAILYERRRAALRSRERK